MSGDSDRLPIVAVLVVNYYSHESVSRLIRSLAVARGDCKVFVSVVDNSMDAQEYAALTSAVSIHERPYFEVRTSKPAKNLGYAGGNDYAWAQLADHHAEVDSVFVVNPDVRVVEGRLDDLIREVQAAAGTIFSVRTHSGGEVLTGQGILARATGRSKQAVVDSARPKGILYAGGHFIAMQEELWSRLGGLSDTYFLYCEEIDLALRLGEEGIVDRILSFDAVTVEHDGGMTTGSEVSKGRKSPVTHYHSSRSRVILYRSHRAVRPYLLSMIATRLLWAILVSVRETPRNGLAVVTGIISGFRVCVPCRP